MYILYYSKKGWFSTLKQEELFIEVLADFLDENTS